MSSDLHVTRLYERNHSHLLASVSAPEHLSSYPFPPPLSLPTGSEMVLAIAGDLGGAEYHTPVLPCF